MRTFVAVFASVLVFLSAILCLAWLCDFLNRTCGIGYALGAFVFGLSLLIAISVSCFSLVPRDY